MQIEEAARDSKTRSLLYRKLRQFGRADLFPCDQSSLELIAESDLTAWLLHPCELGRVPDQIELVQQIDRVEGDPADTYTFYVFRFLDCAEGDKWYAGVAGPYWESDAGEYPAPGVFSRFERFDDHSPEEHLRRAEELVLKTLG